MKFSKIKRYSPGYPTRLQTISNPDLLKKTPDRWKGLLVSGTLFSSALFAGCNPMNLFNRTQQVVLMGEVMVYVELAEDEAVDIIIDEFRAQGYEFDYAYGKNVNAELPMDFRFEEEYEYDDLMTELEVDGMSKDGSIFFEFVSKHDVTYWTNDSDMRNDVYLRGQFLKEYFKEGMFKTENGEVVAAFYNMKGSDHDSLEEELRQQVRDFIRLMEEQGVL